MDEIQNLADYVVVLHGNDNVATALVDVAPGRYECVRDGSRTMIDVPGRVAAGFKLALSNIVEGERIYKYGYVIGLAQMDIKAGHCVHVHNMSSLV
jgi:hypothetical protein